MKGLVLEVGSGYSELHRSLSLSEACVIHFDVDVNAFHLEAVGDVHVLPFRDKMFDWVYCSHVLEHTKNPLLCLREICRVSDRAVIKVPNSEYSSRINAEDLDGHLFGWNYLTFFNFLSQVYSRVDVCSNSFVRFGGNKFYNLFRVYKATVLKLLFGDCELVGVCSSE